MARATGSIGVSFPEAETSVAKAGLSGVGRGGMQVEVLNLSCQFSPSTELLRMRLETRVGDSEERSG